MSPFIVAIDLKFEPLDNMMSIKDYDIPKFGVQFLRTLFLEPYHPTYLKQESCILFYK
jgi:hypothetical protein